MIARDYAKGVRSGTTRVNVDPELVELEIEVATSDGGSEIGRLDNEDLGEEELVA